MLAAEQPCSQVLSPGNEVDSNRAKIIDLAMNTKLIIVEPGYTLNLLSPYADIQLLGNKLNGWGY